MQMYGITLDALKAARIERMWFSVSMKLARLHVDAKRYVKAAELVHELHRHVCHAFGNPLEITICWRQAKYGQSAPCSEIAACGLPMAQLLAPSSSPHIYSRA